MSPSVGNFVHDLVEMAKAMETLPQVQGDLDKANTVIEDQAKTIQSREIKILELKGEIDSLHDQLRVAEVSRDDAEMRFLELDEKTHHVLSALGNLESSARTIRSELTPPPKPEPTPEPEPVKDHAAEELAAKPYEWPPQAEPPQGQSESHPTTPVNTGETKSEQTSANSSVTEDATSEKPEPTPKPYLDKFYYDHPVYVSLQDWLAGGGSEENYYRSKPREYGSF